MNAIDLGPMRLVQRQDGSVWIEHAALLVPVELDVGALVAWLRRRLREVLA